MSDVSEERNQEVEPRYWDAEEERRPPARRNMAVLVILLAIIVGMVGFAFANARYFSLICEAIGFAQTQQSDSAAGGVVTEDDEELGRSIQILFVANVQGQLPVSFKPVEKIQKTQLGKMTVNDYHFVNAADRPVYFMPIHNYRPPEANKEGMIELGKCFCFEPQKLYSGEEKTLPVIYKISRDLSESVSAVTFYYTLFEMTEQDYKEWWAENKAKGEDT